MLNDLTDEEIAAGLTQWQDQIVLGDCLDVLCTMPAESVDLIVTSPPYADSRKSTYGGIHPDEYVAWFLPIGAELRRVLKPDGSFVLNIKEKVVEGERHTYVIELILALRKQGWLWTEEYMWHKRNCPPGKWPNRFRDAWERCLHFNKQKKFNMYQDEVMVPMGDWAKSRLKNLSETDKRRDPSKVGSGFGKNISNWVGRELAYPSNVLHLATECSNKNHSATFPIELPSWFIKLFTQPGDVVLDPFVGSGTTAMAAKELARHYIGIELKPEYHQLALDNVTAVQQRFVMSDTAFADYEDFLVQKGLMPFYTKRLADLHQLRLKAVLKRKNSFLFRAKNLEIAGDFV